MRIQHNIMAMSAYRNFVGNNNALAKNLEKLSSGYRINRAGDDAAGLAISEKMRAQITGLDAAQKNVKDGISLVKTAEGAMQEIQDMMNRMKYLATQSANGTYQNEVDRENLQKEVNALKTEINRIADSANFNGQKLMDGSLGATTSGTMSVESSTVNVADGITINAPKDGAGGKQKYEINLSDGNAADGVSFGAGDSLKLKYTDASGATQEAVFTFDAVTSADSDGKFNTADSLKQELENKFGDYTATVDFSTGKVTLEANTVGAQDIKLTDVSVTDKQVKFATTATAGSTDVVTTTAGKNMGWNDLLSKNTDLVAGDKVTFGFTVGKNNMTVTLEAGKDFAIGEDINTTTQNIADALNNAKFDANQTTTAFKEEDLLVKDYFTVTGNTNNVGIAKDGSLNVAAKDGNSYVQLNTTAGASFIDYADDSKNSGSNKNITTKVGQTAVQASTAGKKYETVTPAGGATVDIAAATLTNIQLTNDFKWDDGLSAAEVSDLVSNNATLSVVLEDTDTNAAAGTTTYTLKFVDADTATGAEGEILVSAGMTAAQLQGAMADAVNAMVEQDFRDASGTTTAQKFNKFSVADSDFDLDTQGIKATTTAGNTIYEAKAGSDPALKKDAIELDLDAGDFSVGEGLTLKGTLSDGRTFSVDLTAAAAADAANNKFAIGSDEAATLTNIQKLLDGTSGTVNVKIQNADGSVDTVKSDEIFGSGKEFSASVSGATTSGILKIESNFAGKPAVGFGGSLTSITRTGPNQMTATLEEKVKGGEQTSAENVLTFDASKIEEGTTVTIDGKTYEFVTDAANVTTDGANAVVLADLGKKDSAGNLMVSNEDIANALAEKLLGASYNPAGTNTITANGRAYDLKVEGDSLVITSQGKGSGVEAIDDIAIGSSQQKSSVVTFNTENQGTFSQPKPIATIQAGDTVTINGKTYEFTDGSRTKDEKNIGVDLKDITGDRTANAVAELLAAKVNAQDGANTVARVDNGSVILTSKFNVNADVSKDEDPYAAPTVSLPKSSSGLTLQIGDTAEKHNQMEVSIGNMHVEALGIGDLDISTLENAQKAIEKITNAINTVSSTRGDLGAIQNRLEHTSNNLSVMEENIQDAESTIRDTDMADEMTTYTKNNILIQAAQAMLAQANQQPQGVLQLLQ